MPRRTLQSIRIMELIARNLKRHDEVSNMHLPYGSHCRAWANLQLDQQLNTILSFTTKESS
jgi:hypothetical protein